MDKILCEIYRSPNKEGLYLYVPKAKGLTEVPAELLLMFGKPQLSLTLFLSPERRLARVDIAKVLLGLAEKGFYLQLPPPPEGYMTEVNRHNDKLAGSR